MAPLVQPKDASGLRDNNPIHLVAQAPGTGLYTFGSFDNRGFDSVNIGNLNAHFEIPIMNKSGRGVPFKYTIVYDGLLWSAASSSGNDHSGSSIHLGKADGAEVDSGRLISGCIACGFKMTNYRYSGFIDFANDCENN